MENLGKTLTRLFVDMEWRFFSKQRRDRKAFRLITSSVRQFDINIHFLKASVPWLVCQVMNMVKTSRQGFLFGTIIYHNFCIWRKFGKICITIWWARHARAQRSQRFFWKASGRWQMTQSYFIKTQWKLKCQQKCISTKDKSLFSKYFSMFSELFASCY